VGDAPLVDHHAELAWLAPHPREWLVVDAPAHQPAGQDRPRREHPLTVLRTIREFREGREKRWGRRTNGFKAEYTLPVLLLSLGSDEPAVPEKDGAPVLVTGVCCLEDV
jgi:hypothetical protein